jgi:hypothetical protein
MFKKILGIILIAGALVLGYIGGNQLKKHSGASIKVANIEVGVTNTSARNQAYLYIGIGFILLAGGVYSLSKK